MCFTSEAKYRTATDQAIKTEHCSYSPPEQVMPGLHDSFQI